MKKTIQTIIIIFCCTIMHAQENHEFKTPERLLENKSILENCYSLANYKICPNAKKVLEGRMFGGVTWDGYGYFEIEGLNYDSTSLIFIDKGFFFKEQLMYENESLRDVVDWKTFQVVYIEDGYSVMTDKNNYYIGVTWSGQFSIRKKYPLPDMKRLNNYLFQDNDGDIYCLPTVYNVETMELEMLKVEGVSLDIKTLRHISASYFIDKNGLYWLGYHRDPKMNDGFKIRSLKLENNSSETIAKVEVKDRYLIFDNKYVYWIDQGYVHKLEGLNPAKMQIISSFATDGDVTYNYSRKNHELDGLKILQVISETRQQWIEKSDGSLYFWDKRIEKTGKEKTGALIRTDKGYYLMFDRGGDPLKLEKYNRVYIYNPEAKKYEILDSNEFRKLDYHLYIYKYNLYGYYNSLAGKSSELDLSKIHNIPKTDFYTDGKNLFFNYYQEFYQLKCHTKKYEKLDENWIIKNVNMSSLRVINEYLLVDKNFIYNVYGKNKLQIIPREKLNLNIQIHKE